jgi:hypothetical protein
MQNAKNEQQENAETVIGKIERSRQRGNRQ